ncbi:hypothetical protein OH76DRAFT_277841 [Lentinus brumalis]|uniref:Uncharacterized protein n=1 Tax=Lentinus brumalis TaxID=2498619 RepID=A0A371CL06_9APHY|nr:hypothetical protein OH76DRAFT_277841 [Polyporus brumalis]
MRPTLAPMATQTIGGFLLGSSLAVFSRLKKAETSAVSRDLAEIFVKGLESLWASHQDEPYPLPATGVSQCRCESRYCRHAQLLCAIEPPGAPYTILLRFASPLSCGDLSHIPLRDLSVTELVFCGVSWRDAPGVPFNTAALPLVLDALRPFRGSLQRLTFEHCAFAGTPQLAGLAEMVRQLPSLHTLALRHCTGLLSWSDSRSLESPLTHPEVWNRLTAVDLEGSCFALALAVSLGVCARSAYYLDSRQSQLQRLSLTLFEPEDVYALLPHLRCFTRLTTLELFFKCGHRGLLRVCSRTESDFPQVFRCLEPPIETTKQVWIHWVDASPLAQYVGPTQYQWAMGVILWRWARVWFPPAFNTVPHAVGVNVSI